MSPIQTGERPGSTRRPIASSPTGNGAATGPASRTIWPDSRLRGRAAMLEELMRVECELRNAAGETPAPEEYRQRFPDDQAAVEAVFGIASPHGAPPIRPPAAAQSLLFGLLALQNNFIDRDTLLAAFNAWVADKSQSLGQILLDRGALSPARHAVLQVLVQEHLQQHGFDPERSLAALTIVPVGPRRPRGDCRTSTSRPASSISAWPTTGGDRPRRESTANWDEESAATDAEGRFRIVRFHDRGALGEVYVARDQQLHRIVALKRIKRDHAVDQDKLRPVRRRGRDHRPARAPRHRAGLRPGDL